MAIKSRSPETQQTPAIRDSDIVVSDITTNNFSTSAHGFTPKGSADTAQFLRADGSFAIGPALVAEGRLTLTSGTPVTQSDVTGATSVLWTPYKGNRLALFDGTNWKVFTFAETTLALGSLTNGQAYDVFAYDSAGTVTLEALEWANTTITITSANPGVVTWASHGMTTGHTVTFTTTGALPTNVVAGTQYFITTVDGNSFKLSTTLANVAAGTFIDATAGVQSGTHTGHHPQARQTALVYQNGVLVKSGVTTRRYLGSFLTTASTTTEDSLTKRFLWNYYNRAVRQLYRVEATASWTYTTNAWRQSNAAVANQVDFMIGFAEDMANLKTSVQTSNSSASISRGTAIGMQSTNTVHAKCFEGVARQVAGDEITLNAFLEFFPPIGRNSAIWQERSSAVGTTTWYGTNAGSIAFDNVAGIFGSILG